MKPSAIFLREIEGGSSKVWVGLNRKRLELST